MVCWDLWCHQASAMDLEGQWDPFRLCVGTQPTGHLGRTPGLSAWDRKLPSFLSYHLQTPIMLTNKIWDFCAHWCHNYRLHVLKIPHSKGDILSSREIAPSCRLWLPCGHFSYFMSRDKQIRKEVIIFVEMTASNYQEDLRVLVNNGTLEDYVWHSCDILGYNFLEKILFNCSNFSLTWTENLSSATK